MHPMSFDHIHPTLPQLLPGPPLPSYPLQLHVFSIFKVSFIACIFICSIKTILKDIHLYASMFYLTHV